MWSLGMGRFGRGVGLLDYKILCGDVEASYLQGDLPTGWLVQLRQVQRGSRILSQGLGPRDWIGQMKEGLVTHILVYSVLSQSVPENH